MNDSGVLLTCQIFDVHGIKVSIYHHENIGLEANIPSSIQLTFAEAKVSLWPPVASLQRKNNQEMKEHGKLII